MPCDRRHWLRVALNAEVEAALSREAGINPTAASELDELAREILAIPTVPEPSLCEGCALQYSCYAKYGHPAPIELEVVDRVPMTSQ